MTRMAFIGGGNMAQSIIGGLAQQGDVAMSNITVSDPDHEKIAAMASELGIVASDNNLDAVNNADVVVLAVKPQIMQDVLTPLRDTLSQQRPLIISIAAGISLTSLQNWTGCDTLVRCMPNTPALYRQGASGMLGHDNITLEQQNLADTLMRSVGLTVWVKTENELDAITALSGSGPAYYFLFMEAMIEAGIALGLTQETAQALTLQTAAGAAHMAQASQIAPSELRQRVTSKGGTTEQALLHFEKADLSGTVHQAMQAAFERSKSLSAELGKSDT